LLIFTQMVAGVLQFIYLIFHSKQIQFLLNTLML